MKTATIQLDETKQDFILNEKNYKTGSRGFYGNGKMQVGDKRYTVNIILVLVGSKPNTKPEVKE